MDSKTEASLCSAKVIVVIASPAFLSCIQKDESRQCMIQDPTNAILFLCGVTVEQLQISGIVSRFHEFEVWAKITHEQPKDLLLRIVANVERAAVNPMPMCAQLTRHSVADKGCGEPPPSQGSPTTSCVDPRWEFKIAPALIRSEVG